MPKDDYDRIVCVVLRELYRCKREGIRMDTGHLEPQALGIHEAYRNDIMEWLLEEGLAKGYKVKQYINGRSLQGLEAIDITADGIHYLKENSRMQTVLQWLKTAKDITPGA
ncbi:MAG: YjcQ family protein [Clostridiales Family XIII bacterium]|jgi:hypothetical protein|nr:YjcQ family protein [Clostridiales Family XIII bacterium]